MWLQAPVSRARSSTLSAALGEGVRATTGRRLHLPLPIPAPTAPSPTPRPHEDAVSLCPSVNSRKDSGIRSTSRRSSIQQQVIHTHFDVANDVWNTRKLLVHKHLLIFINKLWYI